MLSANMVILHHCLPVFFLCICEFYQPIFSGGQQGHGFGLLFVLYIYFLILKSTMMSSLLVIQNFLLELLILLTISVSSYILSSDSMQA